MTTPPNLPPPRGSYVRFADGMIVDTELTRHSGNSDGTIHAVFSPEGAQIEETDDGLFGDTDHDGIRDELVRGKFTPLS